MNLTQAFKIAVKSIAAKKARSALTMLGVIIGLAAVIILVSYAEGQNRQMREYYESLGNNVVNINAYSPSGRDLTKTIRDYCMEDLDDYILGPHSHRGLLRPDYPEVRRQVHGQQ